MSELPLSADPQVYLENLMRAGQDAMKQFDDALATATGVQTEDSLSSGRPLFPFALIADLQREYLKQVWRLWNTLFLQSFLGGAHIDVVQEKGDKQFMDASWREQPYYDLLKQTYLLGSKQQVDGGRKQLWRWIDARYSFVSCRPPLGLLTSFSARATPQKNGKLEEETCWRP